MAEIPKIEAPKFHIDFKRDWPILLGAAAALVGIIWYLRSGITTTGAQAVSSGSTGSPGSGTGTTDTGASAAEFAAALQAQTQDASISAGLETSRYNALANTIGNLAQAISQIQVAGLQAETTQAGQQASLAATEAQANEQLAATQAQVQGEVSLGEAQQQAAVTETALNTNAAIRANQNNTAAAVEQAQLQANAYQNATNAAAGASTTNALISAAPNFISTIAGLL